MWPVNVLFLLRVFVWDESRLRRLCRRCCRGCCPRLIKERVRMHSTTHRGMVIQVIGVKPLQLVATAVHKHKASWWGDVRIPDAAGMRTSSR